MYCQLTYRMQACEFLHSLYVQPFSINSHIHNATLMFMIIVLINHSMVASCLACALNNTRVWGRCWLRWCVWYRNIGEVVLTNSLDRPCICSSLAIVSTPVVRRLPRTNSRDEAKYGQSSYSISNQVWLSCSVEGRGRTIAIVVVGRLW